MANQANLVAKDAQGVPVSHTLEPMGVRPHKTQMIASWSELLTTVPEEGQVKAVMTKELLPSGITKVTMETHVPVMEIPEGGSSSGYTAPPKVAYIDKIVTVGYKHPRSTAASMRNARQIHGALFLGYINAETTGMNTATPPAQLFDSGVLPS